MPEGVLRRSWHGSAHHQHWRSCRHAGSPAAGQGVVTAGRRAWWTPPVLPALPTHWPGARVRGSHCQAQPPHPSQSAAAPPPAPHATLSHSSILTHPPPASWLQLTPRPSMWTLMPRVSTGAQPPLTWNMPQLDVGLLLADSQPRKHAHRTLQALHVTSRAKTLAEASRSEFKVLAEGASVVTAPTGEGSVTPEQDGLLRPRGGGRGTSRVAALKAGSPQTG